MGRPLTAPGPVGGCSLATIVLMGLLIEGRRAKIAGEMDPWFVASLSLGMLLGFAALTFSAGRTRRVAGYASVYLLVGAPVLIFLGAVVQAAGWG